MSTYFDLVVIGGGTGNNVAAAGAESGLETALIEKEKLGGTCLNRGCNPSKMLIERSNIIDNIEKSEKFGIDSKIENIDHREIIDDIDSTLSNIAEKMEERYQQKENLTLYKKEAEFIDNHTLSVDGEEIYGEKIVITAGSRPITPKIDGIEEIEALTSDEAIYLNEKPETLLILGGGYIAVELGYFFESIGTDVKIIEMMDTLIPREDREIAETFTNIASQRHDIYTNHKAVSVSSVGDNIQINTENNNGETTSIQGEKLLVAVGRKPNTDTLNLDVTDIKTDNKGFIKTNNNLETTGENIWAQGDIAGNYMFKHSGDYETQHIIDNVVHEKNRKINYKAMPHAIFTKPQIGSVGKTEKELRERGTDYFVGKAKFEDSAMGRAKKIKEGFAKIYTSPEGEILGCHVIGKEASNLIHEAVIAIRNGDTVYGLSDTIHIHPSLSKVMESAFKEVKRNIEKNRKKNN